MTGTGLADGAPLPLDSIEYGDSSNSVIAEAIVKELNPNGRVRLPRDFFPMADDRDRTPSAPPDNSIVQRLVKEAGVTEQQARDLIAVLGYSWASLIREARFLTKKR
ncbi:MAG: hypothetical protein E5X88_30795 [Mesorhizobium sp.]|uniref:hypothetical protein n=1 Tax=Mesorhizobium sp. TaxID=1871066 RepID=UPI0011F81301|nr:hypothetical protein [Mesorhizobium sp.]TIO04690.1 MAG: hypothetical protein E5X88_30795 [Mesorhizobium sp.]